MAACDARLGNLIDSTRVTPALDNCAPAFRGNFLMVFA
jgi:hypothetical protein